MFGGHFIHIDIYLCAILSDSIDALTIQGTNFDYSSKTFIVFMYAPIKYRYILHLQV